jgi:hypothetical protein
LHSLLLDKNYRIDNNLKNQNNKANNDLNKSSKILDNLIKDNKIIKNKFKITSINDDDYDKNNNFTAENIYQQENINKNETNNNKNLMNPISYTKIINNLQNQTYKSNNNKIPINNEAEVLKNNINEKNKNINMNILQFNET